MRRNQGRCSALKKWIFVFVVSLAVFVTIQCRHASETGDRVVMDLSMVEKGAVWLEMIGSGADDLAVKEYFMREVASTPGCKSIIDHWRRFKKWDNEEFYLFIMEAVGRAETKGMARDENGHLTSFGRRQVFWQEAVRDPERIRRDLAELRAASLVVTALALAKKYLPEEAIVNNRFFIVLFGASSAFAVGDKNGFDLLQLPKRRDGSIDIDSVIRTFAHEMHHTGIRSYLNDHMSGIRDKERLGLVARLVAEGMPTYYINQTKERLPAIETSPNPTQQANVRDWKRHLGRLPDVYAEAERDIRLALDGKIEDEEIMKTWMAGSQGQTYALGSDMFSIIEAQLGRDAAFDVARDYRKLLSVYNRAAESANNAGFSHYVFNEELASRLANFNGR
jgi:hypothetical protein